MEGYILRTGRTLAPFGDPIGDTLVLNRRLEDYQREVLARFCERVTTIDGLDQITAREFLLTEDRFFFTRHFLAKAMKQAEGGAAPLRFALGECYYLEEKAALGGLTIVLDEQKTPYGPLPLVWWRGGNFQPGALDDLPVERVVIQEKKFIPDNIKLLREDIELMYSLSWEGVLSISHWSHVLDMNQVALMAYWYDLSPRAILWYVWKALGGAIKNLSLNPWDIAGNVNVIGRRCDIHPSAVVVGSVLGDRVSIGPNSTVVGCYLGDGAKVEGLTDMMGSVVGAKTVVSFRTKINFSVFYPMAMASYPAMQMCLLGHRALHMGGCFPIDMKLSHGELHDVKVKHEGRIVKSGKKFLGICVGHRSIVGTGLWIQSGVEVPNDYLIVRDTHDIVTKIPAGMEGVPLSLQDGMLRPFGKSGTDPSETRDQA